MIYINAFKHPQCLPIGFDAFRPMMVTITPTHMRKMQACEKKYFSDGDLKFSPGFVFYTNWEKIKEHDGDVLGMPWEDRLGRPVYLDQK